MDRNKTQQQTTKHSITIIGSGNVASHFAKAFRAAGDTIEQVWSRQLSHAEQLAGVVGATATDRWEKLTQETDVVIIAIKDDGLYELPGHLHWDNALVFHTSGSVPIDVLKQISPRYGVVWSPQSFIKEASMDYASLPLCIEGNSQNTEEALKGIVSKISTHFYRLNGDQRKWAHLGAVIVNNFGNALNATAEKLMKERGIPFEIFHPIIALTYQKALKGHLWEEQTGPAVRNDERTLETHRTLLEEDPTLKELYNLMTQIIQNGTH